MQIFGNTQDAEDSLFADLFRLVRRINETNPQGFHLYVDDNFGEGLYVGLSVDFGPLADEQLRLF